MADNDRGQSLLARPKISVDDAHFLAEAAAYLEQPRFLMRVANLVGKPAEGLLHRLPARTQRFVGEATREALEQSLEWAVRSLPSESGRRHARLWRMVGGSRFHTLSTATTGALGGLFGLAGAVVELPATTTLMLRSIAEIARDTGADLADPATRLECLSVFSFGAPRLETMESSYFSSRLAMALAVHDAARYVAGRSAAEIAQAYAHGAAPILVRLINLIASRFQIVVTEKLAASAVPIAGAAMGSLVNAAFTAHFNRVATFHFGILRLEAKYGAAPLREAYEQSAATIRRTGG